MLDRWWRYLDEFMYEAILDLTIDHFVDPHREVCRLFDGGVPMLMNGQVTVA